MHLDTPEDTFNPDTYCGINCSACSIATYGKTGITDEFTACLRKVPKEDLVCGGCKSDNVYHGCRICTLRPCALEKNVEHCIDCSDYPCTLYKRWQKAAKFVPHIYQAETSLETIKHAGVGHWIDSQEKRWSCPSCGTPFSWYAHICSKCGRHLASKTFRLSGWKKFLCRFLFPMVYRKGKAKYERV